MGSRFSSGQSTTAAATANIILQDGQLTEVACPLNVHQVLQGINSSAISFLCDSDDLEFGECVPAMHESEELSPGKLYFVLPAIYLKRPITDEEMVSLAVKASTALLKIQGRDKSNNNGACCRGARPEEMVVVANCRAHVRPQKRKTDISQNYQLHSGADQESLVRRRRGRRRQGYSKGRNLTLRLTVVVEE